jgi:hypothetical protein
MNRIQPAAKRSAATKAVVSNSNLRPDISFVPQKQTGLPISALPLRACANPLQDTWNNADLQ